MHGNSLSARLLIYLGVIPFTFGLVGDGCIGIFFLKTSDLRLLLLHVPLVFIWILGIACITRRNMNGGTAFLVSASIVSPLILGLFTFPGFGPVTYSLALVLTHFLHHEVAEGTMDAPEQSLG